MVERQDGERTHLKPKRVSQNSGPEAGGTDVEIEFDKHLYEIQSVKFGGVDAEIVKSTEAAEIDKNLPPTSVTVKSPRSVSGKGKVKIEIVTRYGHRIVLDDPFEYT